MTTKIKMLGLVLLFTTLSISTATTEKTLQETIKEKTPLFLVKLAKAFPTGVLTGVTERLIDDAVINKMLLSVPLVAAVLVYLAKKSYQEPVDHLLPQLCSYLLGHKLGKRLL